ncbi:YncE family protein [Streptomyces sp. BE20]|uniref:YncE family protein n=1 Tax=Streptomyces sp. BE20 TaxID=3002525 RepID=UPI002E7864D1|nr:YncE family protein [Streptomyces sp. BE20]MEE1821553.1 YncE family protein [Streptomyces sp. BE20]
MNSLASKARWLGSLAAVGALLLTGSGSAGADTGPSDGPVPGVPRTVELDSSPASVAVGPDGHKAYVAVKDSIDGAKVKVVDTQSGAITAVVTLSTGLGAGPGPVAVSPDGSRVYVLFSTARRAPLSTLAAIDTATDAVVSSTAVPDQPRPEGTLPGALTSLAVSPDGARVYVGQNGPARFHRPAEPSARILSFSPQQQDFTTAVPVPGRYLGSIVTLPGGAAAYAATDENLVHLDTSTATPAVAGAVAAPIGAVPSLALSPDGTRLHGVGSSGTGYAVDLATGTLTTLDIAPGQWLQNPSVGAGGIRLYLVQQDLTGTDGAASVLALDTATNTLVPGEGITGLTWVTGLALGPDGHTFYLTAGSGLQIISL